MKYDNCHKRRNIWVIFPRRLKFTSVMCIIIFQCTRKGRNSSIYQTEKEIFTQFFFLFFLFYSLFYQVPRWFCFTCFNNRTKEGLWDCADVLSLAFNTASIQPTYKINYTVFTNSHGFFTVLPKIQSPHISPYSMFIYQIRLITQFLNKINHTPHVIPLEELLVFYVISFNERTYD